MKLEVGRVYEWPSSEQPILKGFHAELHNLWIPHCQ